MSDLNVRSRQCRGIAEHYGTLDAVLQFAHVARPRMVKQLGAGIVSEAHSFPVIPHGVDAQEVFSQEYDVVATLAQWRDMQFDGVDAIKRS